MSGKRTSGSCPYNDGLDCEKHECKRGKTCGWNPDTQRQRCSKIRSGAINVFIKKQECEKEDDESKKTKRYKIDEETGLAKRIDDRDRTEYRRKRSEELIAQGKCPMCGKKTDRPGMTRCSSCLEKEKAYKKAKEFFLGEA